MSACCTGLPPPTSPEVCPVVDAPAVAVVEEGLDLAAELCDGVVHEPSNVLRTAGVPVNCGKKAGLDRPE